MEIEQGPEEKGPGRAGAWDFAVSLGKRKKKGQFEGFLDLVEEVGVGVGEDGLAGKYLGGSI